MEKRLKLQNKLGKEARLNIYEWIRNIEIMLSVVIQGSPHTYDEIETSASFTAMWVFNRNIVKNHLNQKDGCRLTGIWRRRPTTYDISLHKLLQL